MLLCFNSFGISVIERSWFLLYVLISVGSDKFCFSLIYCFLISSEGEGLKPRSERSQVRIHQVPTIPMSGQSTQSFALASLSPCKWTVGSVPRISRSLGWILIFCFLKEQKEGSMF